MRSSILPFFGRDAEKEIIELFVEHVRTTRTAMDAFRYLMISVFEGDFEKVQEEIQTVKERESECDRIKEKIAFALFEGAFLPIMRIQLYKLADNLDDVPDIIENAAKKTYYFSAHKLPKPSVPILKRLLAEADKSIDALDVVLHSLLNRDENSVFTDKFHKMKTAERACDAIQKELFEYVYFDKKLSQIQIQLTSDFGHLISRIADMVEVSCETMSTIRMLRHA